MTPLEEIAGFADVPMDIEVQLDRRILTVREIADLGPGSIIKMTRSAGENLDILIGGALIGFGEIVVTETTTGVRITDFKHEH
jgi:flagellar motor switch protein FliN/FliY